MANMILNDRNEYVVAIGAPASPARVKAERPALLENIAQADSWGTVVSLIDAANPNSRMESDSILESANLIE